MFLRRCTGLRRAVGIVRTGTVDPSIAHKRTVVSNVGICLCTWCRCLLRGGSFYFSVPAMAAALRAHSAQRFIPGESPPLLPRDANQIIIFRAPSLPPSLPPSPPRPASGYLSVFCSRMRTQPIRGSFLSRRASVTRGKGTRRRRRRTSTKLLKYLRR